MINKCYRLKVLFFVFIMCCFLVGKCQSDDNYYYCMVKATLTSGDDIKPVLPFDIYSYRAYSNGKDVTYPQPKHGGQDVIAVVAVDIEDKEIIKDYKGFLGKKFNNFKNTGDYLAHYPYTVKDNKSTDKEEYLGNDKDDVDRFTIWEEEDDNIVIMEGI